MVDIRSGGTAIYERSTHQMRLFTLLLAAYRAKQDYMGKWHIDHNPYSNIIEVFTCIMWGAVGVLSVYLFG